MPHVLQQNGSFRGVLEADWDLKKLLDMGLAFDCCWVGADDEGGSDMGLVVDGCWVGSEVGLLEADGRGRFLVDNLLHASFIFFKIR